MGLLSALGRIGAREKRDSVVRILVIPSHNVPEQLFAHTGDGIRCPLSPYVHFPWYSIALVTIREWYVTLYSPYSCPSGRSIASGHPLLDHGQVGPRNH